MDIPKSLELDACQNCSTARGPYSQARANLFPKNHSGINDGEIYVCQRCLDCQKTRHLRLQDVLDGNKEERRIVVAGPGTGKSHTFKEVLKQRGGGTAIVFTLINNLVRDLRNDLADIDENVKVFSFHAFCKHILHSKVPIEGINNHFELFLGLYEIVGADALLMAKNIDTDFPQFFANLLVEDPSFAFLLERANYYNSASFDDLVFRVFNFYKENPDKIPSYAIVIADEFQDFNLLEASFIRLLGGSNKILLAGDDDQSLYGFRHASNEFIREVANDEDFLKLELPFCSRCTPVLVESTNHFIKEAQKKGLLEGRLDKTFESYWPDKYADQAAFPFIDVADCTTTKAGHEVVLDKIVSLAGANGDELRESKDVPFLIIGPEDSFRQKNLAEFLNAKLDPEIYEIEWAAKDKFEISIEHGYRILKRGVNNNLGWRIILHVDAIEELADILKKTAEDGTPIEELLPDAYKEKHKAAIEEFPDHKDDESTEEENQDETKKIRIKITNYLGSKGLSALHTIIIGLKNGVFPRNPRAITDDEICKFVVALTRAKKSCLLITNPEYNSQTRRIIRNPSIFFEMLPEDSLEVFKCSIKKGSLVKVRQE